MPHSPQPSQKHLPEQFRGRHTAGNQHIPESGFHRPRAKHPGDGACEEGFAARYLRLSDMALPYGQNPCVSGLRVFGLGKGEKPACPRYHAERIETLDMLVNIADQEDTLGWNILFGSSPEKLYHSYMVFAPGPRRVGALIEGREYYVRVDAFNESGITEGVCVKLN